MHEDESKSSHAVGSLVQWLYVSGGGFGVPAAPLDVADLELELELWLALEVFCDVFNAEKFTMSENICCTKNQYDVWTRL